MNLKSVILVSALGLAGAANAQLAMFSYNVFTANSNTAQLGIVDPSATSFDNNLLSPTFSTTATGGLNTVASGTANGSVGDFAGVTTGALAIVGNTGSTGTVSNNGSYVQYLFTAKAGYTLSATDLSYSWRRSSTGANSVTISTSTDGTVFVPVAAESYTTSASSFVAQTPVTLGVTNAQNLYVRFTLAGITGSAGSFRFDNLVVNGATVPQAVPEPSAFAALGLGAVALLRRRRSAK